MSISARLQQLLIQRRVEYDYVPHPEAFTAQQVAQSIHVAGRTLAKVIVVATHDAGFLLAVLPATCHLDLARLARTSGHRHLRLASEQEIHGLFPDCEVGAMPPFGHLYGLPLYVDACFHEHERIWFQAGNHREVVGLSIADYEALARPFAAMECFHDLAGAAA